MSTQVDYMYRDASNYKQFGSFILDGRLDLRIVEPFMWDSEFFIPERVGVRSLVPVDKTRDDHYLHTIESIREVDASEFLMTADTFVERIKRAAGEGWFYEKLSGAARDLARAQGRRTGLANPDWDEL